MSPAAGLPGQPEPPQPLCEADLTCPACSSSQSASPHLELTLWLSTSCWHSPSEPQDAPAAGADPCQGEDWAGCTPPLLFPWLRMARGPRAMVWEAPCLCAGTRQCTLCQSPALE